MPADFKYAKKYAHKPEDVPFGEHFAILCCNSTYIPGDERSRTNPGHGYPAYTEENWDYEIYENREKWEQAIAYKTSKRDRFVPIHANRPKVEEKIIVQDISIT